MIVRCSSLPRVLRCSASADAAELVIGNTSDAAELGTDVHRYLEPMVRGRSVDWDALPSDPETRALVGTGVRMWRDLGLEGVPAMAEQAMATTAGEVTVTGTADAIVVYPDGSALIADWKTGRADSDHREQMRGYAMLLMSSSPSVQRVTAAALWLRTGEAERYTWTRADLPEWHAQVAALSGPRSYTNGPHCSYCSRSHECPAWQALARRDAAVLLGVDVETLAGSLAERHPQELIDLYRAARSVAAIAARTQEALRVHVARTGDVRSDDARLTLTAETRREVDTECAWPILESVLADDELAACVTVRLSRVEEVVATKAGRGNGAKAKRELAARLEAAGALRVNEIQRLTERRS